MLKNKFSKFALMLLGVVILAAGIFFGFFFQNMTGEKFRAIEQYQAANPYKLVFYSVTIPGGEEDLTITNFHTSVTLTSDAQAAPMARKKLHLAHLEEIAFEGFTPSAAAIAELRRAFPDTALLCSEVTYLGRTYAADAAELDLTQYTAEQMQEAVAGIGAFPRLERIILSKDKQVSELPLYAAAYLQAACPEVQLEYTTELYGQVISTDMERIEYLQVNIGDEGLNDFRTLAPMMYNLNYLRLDDCKTTDVATAALRTELKELGIKVVWRVFFGSHDQLTDSYKLWATWSLDTKEIQSIKYCNELKYLDLGHNSFMNLDFLKEMTELEMAILAIGNLQDISGIVNCTKLEYLEIFSNRNLTDEDMQHLSALTNMKYLNISNTILMRDLSFTDSMPKLRKLWNTISRVPTAEINRVKELHPDCKFVFTGDSDPTDHGWRYEYKDGKYQKTPEYELVCARFGYADWDFARYPKGYSREEITYESLGLTPS